MAFWTSNEAEDDKAGSSIPRPIVSLKTLDDYIEAVESVSGVRVVKIGADFCRSCRATAPKLRKMANKYADVSFYEFDYSKNEKFCKEELGVERLPHFEIFVNEEGRKESFPCGWDQIYSKLEGRLIEHLGKC
eukprot:CAMPEP_0182445652 /NCGR_PEP_ID=MMETSP1172-20130603/3708_1 /TAXON_ID=708627 /ORGANISM="Timspurckia oligopyrenoides, Strain CCMP3278" /LENGTH=132 /DNA_ID=CAMNT_0024641463 /DNA_START=302 /DNA_END=700 /DNA_ORIENTATION=+